MICGSSAYDKKYRGEYRTSPVWIGRQGCGISDAAFIPPVGEDMTEAIADLERFIHYNDYDVFVKAAMTHYQFERCKRESWTNHKYPVSLRNGGTTKTNLAVFSSNIGICG